MRLRRIVGIVKKEIKELLRDPISLLTVLLVPVSMMLVFGYGLKLDVKKVPFAVFDLDKSLLSREITWEFISNKEYFNFKGEVNSYKEGISLIDKGEINLLLVFPPKFQKEVKEGKVGRFQALIDGTFPYRAEVIKSYAELLNSYKELKKLEELLSVEPRYWFNESLNQDFVVEVGTVAVVLMISPAVFAALLIVKEKESGTIYNFYSSPIGKWEFLLGKFLAGFTVSTFIFVLVYLMVLFLFQVPQKGSTAVLILGSLVYTAVAVSFGLFISAFFSSQAAAFIGTTVLTIVPSILYSGYLTPVSSMGKSGYLTAHLIPAYYYLKLLKWVFFKGGPLSYPLKEIGFLLLFLTGLTTLTGLTFKKRES
ncbi:ABC transporter permease [Thermovibrio sp.]